MQGLPVAIAVLLVASGALAQQAVKSGTAQLGTLSAPVGGQTTTRAGNTAQPASESTMAELLSRGYEIKAAVPNGGKFIVFMQKDQSAYACEFSSLTGTRCGSIN